MVPILVDFIISPVQMAKTEIRPVTTMVHSDRRKFFSLSIPIIYRPREMVISKTLAFYHVSKSIFPLQMLIYARQYFVWFKGCSTITLASFDQFVQYTNIE